jgi:mono/diheme cytochrome c family protein
MMHNLSIFKYIGAAIAVFCMFTAASSDVIAADDAATERGTVSVVVPALSALAVNGKTAFDAACAACHGPNAAGTNKGPPFVHDIYNPGHHSDEAFFLAAKNGVKQHHWPYGDMPPQPQVTLDQVAAIVRYVRELQLANGIVYRPHRM